MRSMTPAQTAAVIQAVKESGFDPAKVVSCMPAADKPSLGGVQGVMGCNAWDRCPFHLTKNGGFKGHTIRPRNLAVYVRPSAAHPAQNIVIQSCQGYVRQMQNRERDGRRDMEEHGAGEVIRIVGHEGDNYKQIVWVKTEPTNPNSTLTEKVIEAVVPEYKHPVEMAGSVNQRAMAEEMAKFGIDDQGEVGPRKNKADTWADDADDRLELGGGAA